MPPRAALALLAAVTLSGVSTAQSITTTAGPSMKSSSTSLRLAKKYTGRDFFTAFDFETADDPTGGYVNYVSKSYAESEGLASVESNGNVIIRANSEVRATGRGRDSVRLASKDEFADGVYILDLNHMPVGCGTWPAWWTTVKDGWPRGGEIDIVEGANALPRQGGTAWQATGNINASTNTGKTSRNVASLHTHDNCYAEQNTYMTGQLEANTCSAYINGNVGCGAVMGGNTTFGVESFGEQVNQAGGGWYALWRDMEGSGGAYVWFWPRNASNVPDDVRNPDTSSTNVQNWGQPSANLTAPGCKQDFANHVIVFNIAFCGDYAAATYGQSGCPATESCPLFVMNNPRAFAETYWSLNSLRVYNADGRPVPQSSGLSGAQIGGIVGGVVGGLLLIGLLFWRYRVTKRRRVQLQETSTDEVDAAASKSYLGWAAADDGPKSLPTNAHKIAPLLGGKKPRVGPTTLAPGKTARHQLDGETSANFYHEVADDLDYTPRGSSVALDEMTSNANSRRGSVIPPSNLSPARGSVSGASRSARGNTTPRTAVSTGARYSVSQPSGTNSAFAQVASGRRESNFAGDNNKGWVA